PAGVDRGALAGLGGTDRADLGPAGRGPAAGRAVRRRRRHRRRAGRRVGLELDIISAGGCARGVRRRGGRSGMIGMVLAAGWGSRLAPLTDELPKTLLEVDGDRTILDVAIGNLKSVGLDEVVIVTGFRHDVLADRRAALERD